MSVFYEMNTSETNELVTAFIISGLMDHGRHFDGYFMERNMLNARCMKRILNLLLYVDGKNHAHESPRYFLFSSPLYLLRAGKK